ncbi:hypothetical protein QG37_04773 [Candidozyma auris]|nr:hypothetical protein QG37_04773 [[Candida] auris]
MWFPRENYESGKLMGLYSNGTRCENRKWSQKTRSAVGAAQRGEKKGLNNPTSAFKTKLEVRIRNKMKNEEGKNIKGIQQWKAP